MKNVTGQEEQYKSGRDSTEQAGHGMTNRERRRQHRPERLWKLRPLHRVRGADLWSDIRVMRPEASLRTNCAEWRCFGKSASVVLDVHATDALGTNFIPFKR